MRCSVLKRDAPRLVVLALLVLLPACAEKMSLVQPALPPAPPPPPTAAVQSDVKNPLLTGKAVPAYPVYKEIGMASWYGRELNGKKTASGDIFDMYAPSAGHRTLPLGSVIHVINLENARSIDVKVNDRGPFNGKTVLELSYGAARELDFVGQGTAKVEIQTLEQKPSSGPYTVQAALFSEEESARSLKERLSVKYELISILPVETNFGTVYRVLVGSYGTEEKAEAIARKLKLEGLEPLVMRKD